jgi:exopolysaccharide production protein ExoQ
MLLIYSGGWQLPLFGEKADESQSVCCGWPILPAYALGFLLIAAIRWNLVRVMIRQPFLLILMVVAASYFWSIQPDVSVAARLRGDLHPLGLALASRFRWVELAEVVAWTFAVLIVACYVVCIAVPSIGVMTELFPGAWRGLWLEKNALGGLMALGCCLLIAAACWTPRARALWFGFRGAGLGPRRDVAVQDLPGCADAGRDGGGLRLDLPARTGRRRAGDLGRRRGRGAAGAVHRFWPRTSSSRSWARTRP